MLACTASLPLSAKVRLPRLVSDRMVLQRDTELKIWGWASPGEKVTVRFRGKHYNTEADAKGNWLVLLPPQQAGGPFLLEVNELAIRDVLVGGCLALFRPVQSGNSYCTSDGDVP